MMLSHQQIHFRYHLWKCKSVPSIRMGHGAFTSVNGLDVLLPQRQVLAFGVLFAFLLLPMLAFAADDDSPKVVIPSSKEVSLETKDGVVIKCTYYGGARGEEIDSKATVPVILLHGWQGNRIEMDGFAEKLRRTINPKTNREYGHAVIIPDLRGHGESTVRRIPNRDEGQTFTTEDLRPEDFERMYLDLEAVKKYLLERHNAGELNIELLCIVGSEMGSIVALNWAIQDWMWPTLPTFKQGKDVKAYVLVSPPQKFNRLTINQPLSNDLIRKQLSAMILVGNKDRKSLASTNRIHKGVLRFRPPPPAGQRVSRQDLFYVKLDTSLRGTELLSAPGLDVHEKVLKFIDLRLVRKSSKYPWVDRSKPF